MRLQINENNRIMGYGALGLEYPEYEWEDLPKNLIDKYDRFLYRWDGKKPIFDPIVPTAEEKEARRTAEVDQQIQSKLPELLRIIANNDTKGFDDLKIEIKKISNAIKQET